MLELHLSRLRVAAVAMAMLAPLLPAHAAETIGSAVGVTPAAIGTVAGELGVNLHVYRDETVRTGPTGILEIEFLDQTRLALGTSSSAKLDRFVYAGSGRADDVVIGLTRGVFRFATGISSKKAYWIHTPLAGIGVRGTNFTAEITDTYERYTIWEGAIEVCPHERGMSIEEERRRHCPVIHKPGETMTLSRDGRSRPGGTPVIFTAYCAETSAGSRLCGHYGGGNPSHDGQIPPFHFPNLVPPPRSIGTDSGGGGDR
ncbi:FecR family protein [Labrys monachus]|uniref:Ferric-dicitrate binding protein FerR (Iron transport regulator) n=1 Tax=Labrys monachus TaxID=217067 RepID=A0ABU0FFY0_9HYPH|nr:FecR family protein [Labrys monachus]MDQ0393018.1 ferric-dicitrate binding protein FerR (iron transport regulator) [Labrys monachus]